MLWKTNSQGWAFERHPVDADPSVFGPFASLVEIWQGKVAGGRLPQWSQFDFLDFRGWHGWLALHDITLEPELDLYFRLWGVELTNLHGIDLSRKRLSELRHELVGEDALFTPIDLEFIAAIVKEKKIGRLKGPMTWQDRHYVTCEIIRLPLADGDQQVTQLLNATQRSLQLR